MMRAKAAKHAAQRAELPILNAAERVVQKQVRKRKIARQTTPLSDADAPNQEEREHCARRVRRSGHR
jgi:hypothetical protein